jgi:hypothetical protein
MGAHNILKFGEILTRRFWEILVFRGHAPQKNWGISYFPSPERKSARDKRCQARRTEFNAVGTESISISGPEKIEFLSQKFAMLGAPKLKICICDFPQIFIFVRYRGVELFEAEKSKIWRRFFEIWFFENRILFTFSDFGWKFSKSTTSTPLRPPHVQPSLP